MKSTNIWTETLNTLSFEHTEEKQLRQMVASAGSWRTCAVGRCPYPIDYIFPGGRPMDDKLFDLGKNFSDAICEIHKAKDSEYFYSWVNFAIETINNINQHAQITTK